MNNIPSNLDQAPGVTPGPHQPDETINSALVNQAPASEVQSKLIVTNAGRDYSYIFSDLRSPSAYDQSHPRGVNPFFYQNTSPIPNLVLPADFPSGPGLVRMLATYPGNLPSMAEVPAEFTSRLAREVVDHLDCVKLLEVPLVDVTEEWLSSFREFLKTFYEPERVTCYVETIQLLVARYSAEAEPKHV